jgi:hypothetical protein
MRPTLLPNRKLIFLAALALGAAVLPGSALAGFKRINQPNPADPMAVEIYQLDNGLKVYLTENHESPRFEAHIAVRGGNYAAMLDAGTVILALPSNSELTVIKPGDKEYSEVAKIKVADTPVYASPLVVGNKVYVKDRDSLTLWAIE